MPLAIKTQDVIQSRGLSPSTGQPTGFKENFGQAFDFLVREGQSVSRARNYNNRLNEANEALKENGIDFDLNQLYGTVGLDIESKLVRDKKKEYNETVTKAKQQTGDTRLRTLDEIMFDTDDTLAEERDEYLNISGRASGMGKFGNLAGTIAGATTDPLILATLPIPLARETSLLRAMAFEATLGVAVEIPIQGEVFDFKEEVGSPYSLSEAAISVLGAGAGGAAITGLVRGIPQGGKNLINYIKNKQKEEDFRGFTKEEQDAVDYLTQVEEEKAASPFPREIEDEKLHTQKYSQAVDDVANDVQRVDEPQPVSEIVIEGESIPIPERLTGKLQEAEVRAKDPTHKINTPERELMRDRLLDKQYGKGAKVKNKRADLVLGTPGAGKSSAVADPLAKENGAIVVDADDFKSQIPEFDNGVGSSQVHKESSDLAARLLARAADEGDNLILSATGKTLKNLQTKIDFLRSKGYSIHLHHVDLPTSEALKRTISRFDNTGRIIDPRLVAKVGVDSLENFNDIVKKGKFDGITRWDNNVQINTPARVVETTEENLRGGFRGSRGRQSETSEPRDSQAGQTAFTDQARIDEARAAREAFESQRTETQTQIEEDYHRIIDELPKDFRVPIGERIDPNTGEVVTEFTTISHLTEDITESQRVAKLFDDCTPSAA